MASIQEEETQKKLSEIPEVREILDAILDRVQVVMFLEENKEHIGTQNENKQRVEEELRKNIDELNVLEQQVQNIEPLQEAVDLINLKGKEDQAAEKIQRMFRTKKYRALRKKAISRLLKRLIFSGLQKNYN